MRRLPLALTLLPLLAGIGLYWWLWTGWADGFRTIVAAWFPGAPVRVTGFPYRLEAELAAPRLTGSGPVRLVASADRIRINRGPWRPELTLIQSRALRFEAGLGAALAVTVTAATARSSLRLAEGRLERFSTDARDARVRLGWLDRGLAAATLQTHVREIAPAPGAPATAPTGARRGQLVIAATGLRLGDGAALRLDADLAATGPQRLTDYDRWAGTGTIELASLRVADAVGEIATATATLVPQGRGSLRLAGTVATVCPASVAALLEGRPAPSEQRLRAPVRLAIEAVLGVGAMATVAGLPADLATRPRRGQQPPCPRLG